MQKTWVWSLGQEDPLEKGMATHSNILAWRIPWIEEPVGSMGSQRVGQDWVTNIFTFFITQHTSCTIYMRAVVQLFNHDWLFETPMDCSMPGFLVLHYLLEFAQTVHSINVLPCPLSQCPSLSFTISQGLLKHVHWVNGAIQPFHLLSPPFPPALNLSQHRGLFQWWTMYELADFFMTMKK